MTVRTDPVQLHHAYHEAIRRRDFAAIEAMLAADAVYRSPGVGDLAGRPSILIAFRRYFADHPDQVDGDDSLEAIGEDGSLARWWLTATRRSTGERIRRRGRERIRLTPAGTIGLVEVEDE